MRRNMHHFLGFTLIELLIVIVITGIIATIAIASYLQYTQQGRRADGINAILSLSLAEERYRSFNTTYGTLAQVNVSSTSPQGYYVLTVSNVSATSYTITATGQGKQANDAQSGTACSPLVLTVNNGTTTQTPAACWPT